MNQPLTVSTGSGYFKIIHKQSTGSTNDDCQSLAEEGAGDGLVVWADTQTKGRGRQGRSWRSNLDASLTFSLLIRPSQVEGQYLSRFTAMGAMALVTVLKDKYGATAKIKWPNDVLLNGKKICGVLVETAWLNAQPTYAILGMGINLAANFLPDKQNLIYPASSIEVETGIRAEPQELLMDLLVDLSSLRQTIGEDGFIEQWNKNLAFAGETAVLRNDKGEMEPFRLLYINSDGSLTVLDQADKMRILYSGELSA